VTRRKTTGDGEPASPSPVVVNPLTEDPDGTWARWRENFICITTSGAFHQTLRVTPAMEAGVANHVWSVEEIVGLLD
jgi:hypothetical protein